MHSELGFRKHQNITLRKAEGSPDLCIEYSCSFKGKDYKIASISEVFLNGVYLCLHKDRPKAALNHFVL